MSRVMDTAEHEALRLEILELCREAQPYGTNPNVLRAAHADRLPEGQGAGGDTGSAEQEAWPAETGRTADI